MMKRINYENVWNVASKNGTKNKSTLDRFFGESAVLFLSKNATTEKFVRNLKIDWPVEKGISRAFTDYAFGRRSLRDGLQNDWDYDASFGRVEPSKWHIRYPTCGGKRQSPIDINVRRIKRDSTLRPLKFINYDKQLTGLTVANNGHTMIVQLPTSPKVGVIIGDQSSAFFRLTQFHFHWPSEHTINGRRFPLELHLVHVNSKSRRSEADNLVVLTVLFSNDRTRRTPTALTTLLSHVRSITKEGQSATLAGGFHLSGLLPVGRTGYVRYSGSLTSPQCSEVVQFHIFTSTVPVSDMEVRQFMSLRHDVLIGDNKPVERNIVHNARPLQRLNGRTVRSFGFSSAQS